MVVGIEGILGIVATSSFVGGLVGVHLAHRFTLWRDRRKEYNDAVIPLKHLIEMASNPPFRPLQKSDISPIKHKVPDRLYGKLIPLHERYIALHNKSYVQEDDSPFTTYKRHPDMDKLLRRMDKLLKVK